ncbi:MAG: SRPBCC family protein [Akkermansiaceae bacterium]
MPKMKVSEKVDIGVSVEKVYAYLHNFKNWSEWSPWLVCERDCALQFSDDSREWYSWDGKYVGAGRMSLKKTVENEGFDYFLEFLKPWKSKADVKFDLTETEGGVEVVWTMDSSLPWFMWWLKPMMERMIAMDYQRGLKMLKEVLETGRVDSKLEYAEDVSFPARGYLGIKSVCLMDEMAERMGGDFEKLTSRVKEMGVEGTEFFTIYEKWNLSRGEVVYTVCVGVDGEVADVPEGFVVGVREACDAFVVTHRGGYDHLGNAWSAGMMRARSKPPVFKQSKKEMPFEVYDTGPGCEGEEVVTRVVMPVG